MSQLPDLTRLPPGFADPVHHAQASFRCLLDAMARPGRERRLPIEVAATLGRPVGMSAAMAAVALTLLDGQVGLWLAPALADAGGWCRFHAGVEPVASAADADFVLARAGEIDIALWRSLRAGSDERPQSGATVVIELQALAGERSDDDPADPRDDAGSDHAVTCLRLTGPGIERAHRLAVDGLAHAVWRERIAASADYPRGVDLVLTCGDRLVAIPRSTRIVLED